MRQAIQDGTAHYIALGDRHSVTEIEGTDGRAFYAGTPVSTDYGELKPNHVLLVTVDGRDCTVERRAIGTWVFERLTRDLTGEADVDGLAQSLEAVPSKHTTAVKLALRGALNLATTAKLAELLGRNRLTFAALNIWERQADLVVAPDDSDLDGLQVSGYVREALGQLREEAAGAGEEAAVARDALSLLYRLAR
jgi:DNA repair exonuclease SbcCD nuclease subunit